MKFSLLIINAKKHCLQTDKFDQEILTLITVIIFYKKKSIWNLDSWIHNLSLTTFIILIV